jgi:hypothetical protein
VVAVLFLAWGSFFFRNIGAPDLKPVNNAYTQAVQQANSVQNSVPPPPDTTGWVSSASQTAGSNTSQDIQIIQEGGTTGTIDSSGSTQ